MGFWRQWNLTFALCWWFERKLICTKILERRKKEFWTSLFLWTLFSVSSSLSFFFFFYFLCFYRLRERNCFLKILFASKDHGQVWNTHIQIRTTPSRGTHAGIPRRGARAHGVQGRARPRGRGPGPWAPPFFPMSTHLCHIYHILLLPIKNNQERRYWTEKIFIKN